MKRSGVTLEEVASRATLLLAFGRAALGKRGRGDVEAFRADLDNRIARLQSELLATDYRPDPMRAFTIRDPKPRMIHAPSFRDRVVHHALMAHMGPVLDRGLIFDSYACRVGKGSHAAVARAARFAASADWVIHADVAQYFASVDHAVLRAQLRRKFRDRGLLALVNVILRSHSAGRGLPIGALTSQNFANAYLGPIDRLVTEHPETVGYVRYMDDMVWWGRTAAGCEAMLNAVDRGLAELKLTLKHRPKAQDVRLGMTFCGHRILPRRVLLSRRRRSGFRDQLSEVSGAFQSGDISALDFQRQTDAVLATVAQSGSHAWRNRVLDQCGLAGEFADA